MTLKVKENLAVRFEHNPIMSAEKIPASCFAAYNGGVIKVGLEYVMMMRMETMARAYYCWVAKSKDGINFEPDNETITKKP